MRAILTIFILFPVCTCQAQIINGDFEDSLTGWTVSDNAPEIIVTEFSHYSTDHQQQVILGPKTGNHLALLKSGLVVVAQVELSQQITLSAGQTISGVAFFGTDDYTPFNDFADIVLVSADNPENVINLFHRTVDDVGSYNSMQDWEAFTYTDLVGGNYTLKLGIYDYYDSILSSYLAVDSLTVTPEPATLALLGLGFFSLLKRKQ
jgi:hypothetical protein